MRYLLDLSDGGPLIHCRDAHQAALLASLWCTTRRHCPDAAEVMAVRIRALARAAQDTGQDTDA